MIVLLLIISFIVCLYFALTKLINKFSKSGAESIFKKRLRRFRSIKRGYYSLIIIVFFYVLSWFNFLTIHDKPVIIYGFPSKIKAFYMKRDPENKEIVL